MTETQIELSGSCRFTLTTYENIGHKDVCLDYTEHSPDGYYSDTETSIDIDADKAREIVAFMHKAFPEIEQPAQPQQEPLQNIPSLTTVLAYLERLVPSEVYTGMIDIIEDEFQRKQQPAHQEPVKVKTCDTCQFGERCNQWSCKNHSLWKPVQPAQQEPVAWGKPTDEMVQAATDEYDEWANENKGTTECIRAMLSKALKASPQPPAQPQPFEIEWPEYNEHAMGCGLEDIDEYCRYRAMRYGWDCAIEAVAQAIPDSIYTSPPAQRVGLTNKKIDSIQQEWIAKGMSGSRSFARAIEAAHGIKENT